MTEVRVTQLVVSCCSSMIGQNVLQYCNRPTTHSTTSPLTSNVARSNEMKEVKRQLIEARSQITDLYQNHRSTILEKLRFYVAAILLGLAASFLIWMMIPSVDAWQRVQTNPQESSMKPGQDKTPPS